MLNASSVTEFSVGEFNVSVTSMNSTDVISSWTVVRAGLFVPTDNLSPSTCAFLQLRPLYGCTIEFEATSLVNSSSFEVKWYVEDWYNEHELGNDTKYFIIEYMTDNGTYGQTWSDWEVLGNFTADQESALFTYGIDGHSYRFRSIGGDDDGQVEDKENRTNNYDTETLVDLSAPNLTLNVKMEGNLTNIDYIEIEWEVSTQNGSSVIVTGYTAQYRLNGGNWTTFKEDTMSKWAGLNTALDGIYEFRVVASDLAGNKGISEVNRSITVDTTIPATRLVELPEFTDAEQIEINLTQIEDTVRFALYYSAIKEGQETSPVEWDFYRANETDYLITDLPILVDVINQNHYYFKIVAYDLAGNHFLNESYEDIIVDRDPPLKVHDLELSEDRKMIEDGTADVIISFQYLASLSKDPTEYRIYRSTDPNETGEIIVSMEAKGHIYLTYRDVKVDLGEKYYYSVTAVDRMGFESEAETGFIDFEVEGEPVVKDGGNDEGNQDIGSYIPLIGAGLMVILAVGGIGAGYYFFGMSSPRNIVIATSEVVGDSTSNFTEVDGELLCGACGAMFELTDERSCPSCGVFDD
jgi:hypothetical protein